MMISGLAALPNQSITKTFTPLADLKATDETVSLDHIQSSTSTAPSDFFKEVMPLNNTKPLTDEQAMKAAKETMKAFYTQSLQSLFEGIDNDDEDDPTSSETYHSLLVEQIAARMSNTVTRAHERLAEAVKSIDQKKVKAREANKEDFSPTDDKNTPAFFPIGGLYA